MCVCVCVFVCVVVFVLVCDRILSDTVCECESCFQLPVCIWVCEKALAI